MKLEAIRTALVPRLHPEGRQWLDAALDRVGESPPSVRSLFPAAGRHCGRGPLESAEPKLRGWTVDDAVRALLLAALPLTGSDLATELSDLYRYGDAAEKRGVLRGLAVFEASGELGEAALPIVRDALRTNDTRLVAAALGPYAAMHLDPPGYRQGVLKCVFMGVPLADIHGLDRRRDGELERMMRGYAAERRAAGRSVPDDVWLVVRAEGT